MTRRDHRRDPSARSCAAKELALAHELIRSPCRLSAITLFSETRYGTGRTNFKLPAREPAQSHRMVAIETIAAPLTWT